MKKQFLLIIMGILFLFLLIACAQNELNNNSSEDTNELKIVTTYSIIYDIVKNVAGDQAEIHSLAPIGSNPHEYDPLPEDVKATTDADAVFYNGLNLEEGNGWFAKLIDSAGKSEEDVHVSRVSEGVEAIYLESTGLEDEPDPHAWLDVRNGMIYAENVRDTLIEIDPDNAEVYTENTKKYIAQLEELHQKTIEKIQSIPEEKRFLITSEGAFKYFGEAYGLNTGYIWEINSENQGSPQQIREVVDLIRNKGIEALFVETSIDRRSMESVAKETDVPIVGKVFTDSLGEPSADGDTYLKMMEWNIDVIISGLTENTN